MKPHLKYRLNPCDIDRFKALAPIGDALAGLWEGFVASTECPCCLGTRLTLTVILALGIGVGIGVVL